VNARLVTEVTSLWFILDVVVPLSIAVWVLVDVQLSQRRQRQRMQLRLAGKWDELDAHYQRALRSHRLILPFLMRKYVIPGNLEAGYAAFLHQRGRFESALEFTDRAIALARKPRWRLKSLFGMQPSTKTLPAALNLRVLTLTSLGRYDEARATAAELRTMLPSGHRKNSADCLTELQSGNLDQALNLAYETLSHNIQDGIARLVASGAYSLRGDFSPAANILYYEPGDVTEHYSPADLAIALKDRQSVKFIALQRQYAATIHEPIRLLTLADVYIEQGTFDDATRALDAAEKLLGPNPVIRCSYHRRRALCAAASGDTQRAEQHLREARSILQQHPTRSTQWETHMAAGRCHLALQAIEKATAEFQSALGHVLHPIEKHVTNYWLGRAAEAARHRADAIRHYQNAVADGIETRMRQEATEALARLKDLSGQ